MMASAKFVSTPPGSSKSGRPFPAARHDAPGWSLVNPASIYITYIGLIKKIKKKQVVSEIKK